ncbi:probable poly [ADP-ribose] polymerase DDB_G0278045 [Corticium candelabrum]|uniref:probable poly [ADP-ribose] polymerase DDB_G0278045 n=1 Tax=Corticium candelabrum TaxID=121492 RepID=UPI002E25CE95|nr:probable poly [ADP-ribose] polymerase DDB_G0278045 [Corticium candelabrum]
MPGFKIKKIERIQRFYLWHEYQLAKHRMAMKNEGEVNEMELFHGTNQTDPSQIYKSPVGFDIKYADSRGRWGTAIYFARKASYSHRYCYAKDESGNRLQMFLAKVLTGICDDDAPNRLVGRELRRPYFRPDPPAAWTRDDACDRRYDSLSGVTSVVTRGMTRRVTSEVWSRVYAIFDNFHAYPYYLITYAPRKIYVAKTMV